jgi:hypothetical protein
MSDFFPIVVIILLLAILGMGFILCGWRVIVAFLLTTLITPFVVVFFIQLVEWVFSQKAINLSDLMQIGGLFALGSIPIYFILILPLYYRLSSLPLALSISFPSCVSIILVGLAYLVASEPLSFAVILVLIACASLHALLILWLIARLQRLGVSSR